MDNLHTTEDLQVFFGKALKGLDLDYQPVELYDPIAYSLSIGGKRMRPLLCLMACDMFSGKPEFALPSALAVEVFHNFTLVHDDIMDNAPLRRGKETVFKKWNSNIAILAGDTMFALACHELIKSEREKLPGLMEAFTIMARQVCEGQQMDMNFESQDDVSICDYIDMITLKTAALLGCSLYMGARAGNAFEEDARMLSTFGEDLGVSFQIRDDLLDVFGNEEIFGKKNGGDIVANKKTFLYLRALEVADKSTRHDLVTLYADKSCEPDRKVREVTDIYTSLHIREMAEDAISRYYHHAQGSIDAIKVDDDRKSVLKAFAESLMFRQL
jgi:geranylgeranyl diphosphate synthase, type II